MAYETPCYQGLAYTAEKHVCDYPDNVPYCDKQTESVVGFKCPAPHELPPNAVARRFLPYPRYHLLAYSALRISWLHSYDYFLELPHS